MKKGLVIIVAIIVVLTFSYLNYSPNPDTGIVKINDVSIIVEIADEVSEQSTGLMYRESLDENSGMFFIFDKEQNLYFWMKNVKINLDMIFINENYEVVGIVKDVKPCNEIPCKRYGGEFLAKYVLEVNGGFSEKNGISVGDEVKFTQNL